MKQILISIFLFFCTFAVYSQNIEDKFTKQNWNEYHILTEGCQKIDVMEVDGEICPIFLDEQGFCFYVTLNEGFVFTVTIKCNET